MKTMNQNNMRKLVVSEWVTLDGVFDADTMDQWWIPYDSVERQEYIKEGILGCDAMLYGHTTYEMLAPYWSAQNNDENGPATRLNSVRKYVVSTTLKKAAWNNSTIFNENVVEEITRLKQQPGQEILITGSATLVQTLIEADLIDEYRFLVQPIIMGSGKHFFKDGMHTTRLKLVKTKTLSLGVIALTYQPNRK
jgi:dihydrofolate reductase